MAGGTPFLVLALPRSRTAWLARFLSYRDYRCAHEQARTLRSLEDAQAWLAQDFTGTAETSVARWWRLIPVLRPQVRVVLVRRPVEQVVASLLRLDMRDIGGFNEARLWREMGRLDRALDRIERGLAGVLSVRFADLADPETCRRVWEHCLPYPFDRGWWAEQAAVNVQCDMPSLMRYARAHAGQLAAAGRSSRRRMRGLLGAPVAEPLAMARDGVVIRQERLETFWRDAQDLFRQHCLAVGEPADQFLRKNLALIERLETAGAWHFMTARCNGRMLGYLASLVAPSIETPERLTATQTLFFTDPDARGMRLGMRLQKAAIRSLHARGVGEIAMRAGVRGDGGRLDVLYRRLGAQEFGALYRLDADSFVEQEDRAWASAQSRQAA